MLLQPVALLYSAGTLKPSVYTLKIKDDCSMIKEAYSNLCMKIHLTQLTQYLTNIFKMRFMMRNCIKYAQQCQKWNF